MPSTLDKAQELNLDGGIYGTFAEIGAGQETANWFFRASGSAGLVAKSISAYDMTMSDAIYGKCDRYVSRMRLRQMLDHEFSILLERLGPKRGDSTTFFAFCNTVRARGYQDSGECHGWLGLRFQLKPGDPPSDIFVHIRLLDASNPDQMEALGVAGVNLIHAAFHHRGHLSRFVASLVENIRPGRVEIDMLKFHGHGYGFFDNRLCSLALVEAGLTEAAMFLPDGEVVQAAEALYKRPILLLRGSFDPVSKLHLQMLEQAREVFSTKLEPGEGDRTIELCEMTMANLLRGRAVDHVDFIDRCDALQALGKTVLVSRYAEFHRIAAYLSRSTERPIGIVLSIGLLNELFKAKWSEKLAGGLLESFGRLFKNQVTLYVYPWKNRRTGEMVDANGFKPPAECGSLYRHFLETGRIRPVPAGDEGLMRYTGRDIRAMIERGDPIWRSFVPEAAHRSASHAGHHAARLPES
ncbi:MAG: TonB-dependent receptor [Verrucomicrobia bacterium]|nr:MAG: TonB-dependent receptor [Verrucomicrobiota bacterium]TAE88823.1 MAG: TonB-dependent receptor [Verrucomicrobiota bacterium]TAF27240.1 MAG: TonB-dependent receptor [Verrucomicrobiota bacterium]TAF42471.1 MAG: TonB-dependent receptor [Verrucomicrobiota bacterium]